MILAICVISGVLSGALTRVIVGWLGSGEPFSLRKFLFSAIPTIYLALPLGLALLGSKPSVDTIGLIVLTINALLSGWGIPDGVKQVAKMQGMPASNPGK